MLILLAHTHKHISSYTPRVGCQAGVWDVGREGCLTRQPGKNSAHYETIVEVLVAAVSCTRYRSVEARTWKQRTWEARRAQVPYFLTEGGRRGEPGFLFSSEKTIPFSSEKTKARTTFLVLPHPKGWTAVRNSVKLGALRPLFVRACVV